MNDQEKQIIYAGGGLVENEEGKILVMFRRGKWDLPKGKSDPGESFESCALREVEEETGVSRLQLTGPLLITRHEYREKGLPVVKETHWFSMKAPSGQTLVPQLEEDITELRWLSPDELGIVLKNTYPTIVDVLKAGGIFKGIVNRATFIVYRLTRIRNPSWGLLLICEIKSAQDCLSISIDDKL